MWHSKTKHRNHKERANHSVTREEKRQDFKHSTRKFHFNHTELPSKGREQTDLFNLVREEMEEIYVIE